MCFLWSFVFLILQITFSVEGSSYCMADCDSNGQRQFINYEKLCCSVPNKGKIIPIIKDSSRSERVTETECASSKTERVISY